MQIHVHRIRLLLNISVVFSKVFVFGSGTEPLGGGAIVINPTSKSGEEVNLHVLLTILKEL